MATGPQSDPDNPNGSPKAKPNKPVRQLTNVAVRFAGDSGDGMQLAAASSLTPRPCWAMMSALFLITLRKSAPRLEHWPVYRGFRFISALKKSTRPAMKLMPWSR